MNFRQHTPLALALSATLATTSSAQSLLFDGMVNAPVGASTLMLDAAGFLAVDNLGSSGLDGVRASLGDSEGFSITPLLALAPNQGCSIQGDLLLTGATQTVPVSLDIQGDPQGGWNQYTPDFSSLGQQTYGLRIYLDDQIVFEQDDLSGPTRMQTGMTGLPQKVYMLPEPFTLVPGPHLVCADHEGGVTPPGGNTVAGDFVEFFSQPTPIDSIQAMRMLANSQQPLLIQDEELRKFDHFLHGIGEAALQPQGDAMLLDNLGSSGCDGVSIALDPGTDFVEMEMEELAAPDLTGATLWLETRATAGPYDRVAAEWSNNQLLFTPDFGSIGSNAYTLELFLGGNQVYSESGKMGPALLSKGFRLFYKKTITHPDGTVESEWCIAGNPGAPHEIVGGPIVQADMFIVRSEGSQLASPTIDNLQVRAADLEPHVTILKISASAPDPCVGDIYCEAAPNSVGAGAQICASGSTSVADNDLVLTCTDLPPNQFGIFFYGANQTNIPLGNGILCVGGTLYRLPIESSNNAGVMTHAMDNTSPPSPSGQVLAGQVWNFQTWYRDPAAGGASFNLSNALSILFTP